MADNIIIDGSNLAYRTYHALKAIPEPLVDKQGRPTGLLFGFLRGVSTLKKRFSEHQFYVVWDGSKQRRKSRYPEYKAHRSTVDIFSDGQMDAIRECLPNLGVFQAKNPDEEADDVIASLVRVVLKDQKNTILSTDHDFLQLVTFTTSLLIPKVGPRSELLYDPDKVLEEYGVLPEKILQLRSMLGDPSDNLPGVPMVPSKVLKGLLKQHGTVQGIFSSHMAGLTSKQYEKLRGSKDQVLLNLELMALQDVPVPMNEVSLNEARVKEILTSYDITPDIIVDAFFKAEANKGFVKTS